MYSLDVKCISCQLCTWLEYFFFFGWQVTLNPHIFTTSTSNFGRHVGDVCVEKKVLKIHILFFFSLKKKKIGA